MTLFTGFHLNDQAYHAFYSCANLPVAVSGDNSLEHALSSRVVPFYRSYNYRNKEASVSGLRQAILGVQSQLPPLLVADFLSFFEYNEARRPTHKEKLHASFRTLHLEEMSLYWPVVVDYLLQHHNFYTNLEAIFYEQLAPAHEAQGPIAFPLSSKTLCLTASTPAFFATSSRPALISMGVAGGAKLMAETGSFSSFVGARLLNYTHLSEQSNEGAFSSELAGIVLVLGCYFIFESARTQSLSCSMSHCFQILEHFSRANPMIKTIALAMIMALGAEFLDYSGYELAQALCVGSLSLHGVSYLAEQTTHYLMKP